LALSVGNDKEFGFYNTLESAEILRQRQFCSGLQERSDVLKAFAFISVLRHLRGT